MKHHPMRRVYLLAAIAALLLVALATVSLASQAGAQPPTSAEVVRQAWQRARDLGSYRFVTDLEATISLAGQPAPSSGTRYERLNIEGQVDLPAQKLEMTLWDKGGRVLQTQQGIELRVEGNRTYGRVGSGAWQELEGATDAFAPGQDPLAFLAGATDFYLAGTETKQVPMPGGTAEISFSRYAFTMDGPAFAEHMRAQLERRMAARGSLPPGVTVDVAEAYRALTGQGEIWIDEAGLPLRLTVDLEYPPQNGEQSRSRMQTDFSGFPDEVAAGPSILEQPLAWAQRSLGLPATAGGWGDLGIQAGLLAGFLGLGLVVVARSRSRAVYAVCTVVIILSMVFVPLCQSQQVQAFYERMAAQQQEAQEQQAAARLQQALVEAQTSSDWDPVQDPLAAADPGFAELQPGPTEPLLTFGGTQQALAVDDEPPPDPNSDEDLDGLTYQEEVRLGTDPELLNSDLDDLADGLEVKGFVYGGTRYYTDPLSSDTIHDGVLDTLECWTTAPDTLPTNSVGCNLDTDGDGELDIFDRDNDDDGVPDAVDVSPFSAIHGLSDANPFQLVVNNLEPLPVLVDLQIRPNDAKHLGYTFSVLDWPTGDTQGQVQRVFDTTFATAVDDPMTPEEIETDPRVAYGDMRLIPMLEIRVEPTAGSRNLPVKPGYGATPGVTTPLEEWLDTGKLEDYGMSAHYLDEAGTLAIYVPLNLVEDETGGRDVAFLAHFYYEPAGADWGKAHQMRAVWWVQMLVDQCDSDTYDEDTDGEFEAWCAKPENRVESAQIVHTYPEAWSLTGLSVREDHGLEAAVAFEDPDTDNNVNDDTNLWRLIDGLDGSFLASRDEDGDNERDITVVEIERRWNNETNTNNGIPEDDPRLWGISKTSLEVWREDLPHQDTMITLVTTTTMEILSEKFLPVSGCPKNCNTPRAAAPTLLYTTEATARTANLDMSSATVAVSGGLATVGMASTEVKLETVASASWVPYRYDPTAQAWDPYPLDEYVEIFQGRMEAYFHTIPDFAGKEEDLANYVLWATCYYLGIAEGISTIVEIEGQPVSGNETVDDVTLATYNVIESVYRICDSLNVGFSGVFKKVLPPMDVEMLDFRGGGGPVEEFIPRGSSLLEKTLAGIKMGTCFAMAVTSMVFAVLALTVDSDVLRYIQAGLMLTGSTILLVLSLPSLVQSLGKGFFKTIADKAKGFTKTPGFALAIVGAGFEIGAQVGLFIYTVVAGDVDPSSIEFDAMLANLIATIIVVVILTVIYNIPIIGDVIYAVVSVLNWIINIVCTALGEDFQESEAGQVVCGGISGMLSWVVAWLIFSTKPILDAEYEGLEQSAPRVSLAYSDRGFQVDNELRYTMQVTQTIRQTSRDQLDNWKQEQWSWQFNEKNLKKSTYDFALSPQETDLHGALSLGQETGWACRAGEDGRGGLPYCQVEQMVGTTESIPLISAGLNLTVSTYYNVGYVVPVQECWGFPPISGCGIKGTAETGHEQIGKYFEYDVFPDSLDGFHTLEKVSGGYRLNWAGPWLQFPPLRDADGDGLVFGTDPSDTSWDADGDGLSDPFEQQTGTDPRGKDTDGDSLDDGYELLYGADPTSTDGDQDGLSDKLELEGWDFVYGWVDEHTPKIMRVTSDPLLYDTDFDGVSDRKEWLYGWNPRAVSEGKVLSFSSNLSEQAADGTYAASDGVVKKDDQIRYEAEIKNELDLRYAHGLLTSDYPPGALSGSVDPKAFVLAPREPATIQGDLAVQAAASTQITLTQIAGAELYDAHAASNYAELLLHLEEAADATVFLDESGGVERHNGACEEKTCPQRQVEGWLGKGVKFTALGQHIDVGAVDISGGDLAVTLWMRTTADNGSLLASQRGYVSLVLLNGNPCAVVRTTSSTKSTWGCAGATVNDGEWHHLALNYHESDIGGKLLLYVDGGEAFGSAVTRAPEVPGLTLGYDYVGDLDEVTVYKRALTAEDIQRAAAPRPVLHARLDEPVGATTFIDASGQNTGSCTTNCPTMGQPAVSRTAAQFDGVDDYLLFADNPSLNFDFDEDFTVMLWMKVGNPQVGNPDESGILAWKWHRSGGYPYKIRYTSTIGLIWAERSDGSHQPLLQSTVPVNDGRFHHVAVAKQGGTLYLYIDGVLRGSAPDTTTGNTTNTSPLYIGAVPFSDLDRFQGVIDELRIYRRGLSQAEVQELYANDAMRLYLHLDDAPGTYLFQEAGGREPASCPSNLAGCPTSGVAGRMNQAALFAAAEGDSLATKASLDLSETSPGATLSASVYPTSGGPGQQVVLGTDDGNSTTKEWRLWRDNDKWAVENGYLFWRTILPVDLDRWQHIAVVFNPGDGSTTIYKNGGAGGSERFGQVAYPNHSNTISVGCDAAGSACFQGRLDEVQVHGRALSASEVAGLSAAMPVYGLHLEEALGAGSFADYAGSALAATCSGDACPNAGVKGQVGLAAEFDGLDDGLSTGYTDQTPHETTIMAWVRANSATDLTQAVIASKRVYLELYRQDGTWRVRCDDKVLAPAEATVRPEEWQHLAVVITNARYSEYPMTLYLNGSQVGSTLVLPGFYLIDATIGFDADNHDKHFDGRIDEVAVYDRPLSAAEIKAIYDYQAGWEEQVLRTGLTIDNDTPTARLVLTRTMVAQQPIQLRIETSDPTSAVSQAEWRVNGSAWNAAPPCHGADYGAAWCPIFTPSGSGSYTIEAQAIDQVGHYSEVDSVVLQVDGAAPTATLDQEGTLVRLAAAADRPYAWTASLSGTVSDAAPSSGVAAVRVALIDPFGVPVAGGSQAATVGAGSPRPWSLTYRLDEPLRTGLYTVQLEAEDQVGNHSTERGHSVALDRTAPEVSFEEQPLPGGGLIMWHLEEAAGATRFLDSSGMGNDGICDLSCPTAGVAGKYGSAVLLPSGGSASIKAIRSLAFDESGLSLSAWFQTSATSQQTLLAATNASTGAKVVTIKLDSSGTVHMTFSPADAGTASISTHKNQTFNDGAWHHVSAQWHPGQIRLYLDGQVVKTVGSVEGTLPASLNIVVGHDGGTDRFAGYVDEVAIQGVWLNPDEVRSLAFTDPRIPQNEVPLAGVLSEIEAVPDTMLALHLEETATPPSILLVDDDLNGPDMLPYYDAALDNLGYQYDLFTIYPPSGNGPGAAQMAGYDVVIWFSGDNDAYGGPTAADEAALAAFLDGGGSFFLSSQDYLHKMGLTDFGRNYLGVASYQWPVGHASTAYGVMGDPIGGGLGPYPLLAPSQFLDYGLAVNPAAGASVAFRSAASGGNNLDVDKDGGNWKTVHFGTEWALIQNASAANGRAVMQRILNWFGGSQTGAPVFSDSSVYANDATCTSPGCPTADATGSYGAGRRFDGVDDGLTIASSSLPYLQNNLTVMAWIKPEDLGGVQLVLGAAECNQTGGLSFGTNGSRLIFRANGVQDYSTSRVTLAANQWQHIAAVMDADNSVTFYVDGTARETIAGSAPLVTCTGDIQVGRSTWDGIPWAAFQGSIDEVHVFDRALTPEQVLALGHKQNAGLASLQVAYTSDLAGSPLYNAPMPQDVQLYLPFDDTPGAVGNPSFVDISGGGHSGSCDPASTCPSIGHPGHAGTAAWFDGVDDYVKTGRIALANISFTVAFWAKRDATNRYDLAISQGTVGTNKLLHVGFRSNNVFTCAFYGNDVNTTHAYTDTDWHHWACTYDAATGTRTIYRDGVRVETAAATGSGIYQGSGDLYVGRYQSSYFFKGSVDEVIILSGALSAADVRTLYRGTEPVLHLPFDESWAVSGGTLADSSGWENHGTLTSGTNDAANKALPGRVGAYALQFDGNDDYVNAGSRIDLANASFSVAVWARRTEQRTEFLMGQGVGGTNTLLQIGFRNTGRFLCNFYGDDLEVQVPFDTNWHHWACTYDAANNTRTVYRDGVQVGQQVASADFQGHGDLIIGRYVPGGYYFAGLMDDLFIHPRALSAGEVQALYLSRWQPATLSGSGSTVMRGDWSADLPQGLEGHYRFDVSAWDLFDNHQETRSAWDGVLDSKAPRATLTYEGGPSTYTYHFSAEDWNLDEGKLDMPCPSSTEVTASYFNAPWYRALTGVTTPDSSRLYSLAGTCQVALSSPAQESLTTCDLYGNCTTVTATPATTLAAAPAPAQAAGQVLILEPAPEAIVSSAQSLALSGLASSDGYLKRLTVSVDGKSVLSQKWNKGEAQTFDWSATWPPASAGQHIVEADLSDWDNQEYRHEITFTLDSQPPSLAITTAVLTGTHVLNGQLPIQGTAADENGIAALEVRVAAAGYGSDWTPATLDGEGWQALPYPGHGYQPDGELLSIEARAADRAGWSSTVTQAVTADLQPPAPVELEVSYDDGGGIQPITQTGVTIAAAEPVLHLRWTASSDGSGLAGYRAGWTVRDSSGVTETLAEYSPADERLAPVQAGEAQRLTASVTGHDAYGNRQSQAFGPIYADSPLTPDYIRLDDAGEIYRGWMEGGCSLLGTDRRAERMLSANATRDQDQALYATWDQQALRLAWTGANWSGDGDLFVHLDTAPGGTLEVLNPYTSTATALSLPGMMPVGPLPNAMYADYAVWVQDGRTAWLYRWDGAAWVAAAQLGADRYRFEPGLNGGQTDLYLPFELLGIADPAGTPLKLVAMATEEGSLQLWAVLPQSNPVTSSFVTGLPQAGPAAIRFALSHGYRWEGLGAGTCPNGSQALAAGQRQYTDDDLRLSVTVDPAGAVYRYLGDHLFAWWQTLFGDKPAEFGSLLGRVANDHARLRDGQEVVYTVQYENGGAEAAQDVVLQVRGRLALILPDGASLEPEEHIYYQEIAIGDVAPGQAGTVTVRGKVDLAWAESAYQACLAQHPDHPLACAFHKQWALLGIRAFDAAHATADGPREWMWVDHRVDSQPPLFTGLLSGYQLSATAGNALRGYAYDESGVVALTLEVEAPDGTTRQWVCNDPTPLNGQWGCGLSLAEGGWAPAQDGDVYRIRLRAQDGAGLVSEWSPWQTFVADGTAPEVAVGSVPTYTVGAPPRSLGTLALDGQVQDNYGLRGVEVCHEERCRLASTQYAVPEWSYPDTPAEPLAIGTCGGGELVREFSVPEGYAVGRVRLGFQAEIADRDRLVVELTSPAGTRWQLVGDDYDTSTDYANWNVVLADSALAGLPALRADQPLTSGGFGQAARPLQPLAVFRGQGAAGTWRLSMCDTAGEGEPGLYHGAQLWVDPPNTAPLSGTWRATHQFGALDDVEQTLLVYGIDEAGNRSPVPQALTFRVDNVTPVLTVTQVITQVQMQPDLAPVTVLAGTAADGGKVARLHAYIRDPEGISASSRPVVDENLAWHLPLQPMLAGSYQVWVAAEDEAGNLTTAGPFSVEVAGIAQAPAKLYLPLISKGSGGSERAPGPTATVTVTPTLTITPTATMTPTVTITPTATITPTVTPTSTITPTVAPTSTLTPTATVTPTATMAPTIQPTATITPALTLTPTVTMAPAGTVIPAATMALAPEIIVAVPRPWPGVRTDRGPRVS